jgi:hypothetical protein
VPIAIGLAAAAARLGVWIDPTLLASWCLLIGKETALAASARRYSAPGAHFIYQPLGLVPDLPIAFFGNTPIFRGKESDVTVIHCNRGAWVRPIWQGKSVRASESGMKLKSASCDSTPWFLPKHLTRLGVFRGR